MSWSRVLNKYILERISVRIVKKDEFQFYALKLFDYELELIRQVFEIRLEKGFGE